MSINNIDNTTRDKESPNSGDNDANFTNKSSSDRDQKSQITEVNEKKPVVQQNKIDKELQLSQKLDKLAKELKIKPKTIATIELMRENPKLSQGQAWMRTHNTTNIKSATATASQVLRKPSVIIYKQQAIAKAKKRIVQLVDSDREDIALKASKDILDRSYPKETTVTTVKQSIEDYIN